VFVAATTIEEAYAHASKAEILAALAPRIPADLVATMPRLEWVHALTTGVDNLLMMPTLGADIIITNSRGIHGLQMSELAILQMLALARKFPEMLANQRQAKWERWPQPLLLDKTVCIVGLGVIAEALAARCRAFGMRVTGVSNGRQEVDGFDRIYRRADLKAAASEADFLVVVVPYSQETHHLINAEIFEAMKPSAYFINISRDGCVDEVTLLAHLRAGQIAGAALDVFEATPLPTDSPLWSQPNLILTPQIGGMSDIYARQALPIFISHLKAYAEGGAAALQNRVNRSGKPL